MKAWLKGGIIGLIIGVILILFYVLMKEKVGMDYDKFAFSVGLPLLFSFLLSMIVFGSMGCEPCFSKEFVPHCPPTPVYCDIVSNIIFYVFGIIFYFLIGALIGWIIGKIKNRKK